MHAHTLQTKAISRNHAGTGHPVHVADMCLISKLLATSYVLYEAAAGAPYLGTCNR